MNYTPPNLYATSIKNASLIFDSTDYSFKKNIDLLSKILPEPDLEKVIRFYDDEADKFRTTFKSTTSELQSRRKLTSILFKYLDITKECLERLIKSSPEELSKNLQKEIDEIEQKISGLKSPQNIEYTTEEESLININASAISDLEKLRGHCAFLEIALEKYSSRTSEIENEISRLSLNIIELESPIKTKYEEIKLEFTKKIRILDEVESEINKSRGRFASKVIAESYDKSAQEERSSATWLRNTALGCMLAIACVVGYTLYEITTKTLTIELVVLRITFALIISIPATYLARESTKHRQQYYMHLQTSLDLKTITPYIASLPSEIQNKIKEEMASRIFSQRNFDGIAKESYPINTHDILIKLLDKLEFKTKSKEDAE